MKTIFLKIITMLSLLCIIPYSEAICKEIYLQNGIGLPGELEIGQQKPPSTETAETWQIHPSGLRFKTDESGRVVVVVCKDTRCITDRNIALYSDVKSVLRRYGAPIEENKTRNGVFYQYRGVGFEIRDNEVIAIYIVPRFR